MRDWDGRREFFRSLILLHYLQKERKFQLAYGWMHCINSSKAFLNVICLQKSSPQSYWWPWIHLLQLAACCTFLTQADYDNCSADMAHKWMNTILMDYPQWATSTDLHFQAQQVVNSKKIFHTGHETSSKTAKLRWHKERKILCEYGSCYAASCW